MSPNNPDLLKPVFIHGCEHCVFLGGYIQRDEQRRVDFYYHDGRVVLGDSLIDDGKRGEQVVFYRISDHVERCCPVEEVAQGSIFEIARRRAQELGLLNKGTTVRPPILAQGEHEITDMWIDGKKVDG